MAKKVKASQNKAQVVETPDYQPSLDYIDRLMQKAPASRQEHQMGQQALIQVAQAIQQLKQLAQLKKEIKEHGDRVEQSEKKIDKLLKRIDKLKGT